MLHIIKVNYITSHIHRNTCLTPGAQDWHGTSWITVLCMSPVVGQGSPCSPNGKQVGTRSHVDVFAVVQDVMRAVTPNST